MWNGARRWSAAVVMWKRVGVVVKVLMQTSSVSRFRLIGSACAAKKGRQSRQYAQGRRQGDEHSKH